jgi:hypothetical protein
MVNLPFAKNLSEIKNITVMGYSIAAMAYNILLLFCRMVQRREASHEVCHPKDLAETH